MNEIESRDLMSNPNERLASRLKVATWFVTAIVLLLVGLMRQVKIPLPDGVSLSFLPAVHAVLNTLVFCLLLAGLYFIKRRNVAAHRRAVSAAMLGSVLFLLCYVAYHFTSEETRYGGVGVARTIYFFLLISHILLAAISLPFILYTWIYGFTNQFAKHRQLAKWVFPMWLYVAATGPICYLMLRPYYQHG